MLSPRPVKCPAYLLDKAANLPVLPTAVVGAGATIVLETVRAAKERKLIEPILVGDQNAIFGAADEIGWDVSTLPIEHADNEHDAATYAANLAGQGDVAALMKGNVHTDSLMRAVLDESARLRTDRRLSHVFHMTVPDSDQVLFIADAVINVNPTVAQKIDIIRNAVEVMQTLGIANPKVAVLSATEQVTSAMPSSEDAAKVVKAAHAGAVPGALIDGPLSFDVALSPAAAKIKNYESPVAGAADLLLVPNIETGNALFKQMVYFMGAAAAGLVLGARVPIMLTSRADPPAARLASAALATIYSANTASS